MKQNEGNTYKFLDGDVYEFTREGVKQIVATRRTPGSYPITRTYFVATFRSAIRHMEKRHGRSTVIA